MNITLIETDDKPTIERIAAYLIHRKMEFITKPGIGGDERNQWVRGTCFVVFCSRTNWELFEIYHKLKQNRQNYFEIRGVANTGCRGAEESNIKSCYGGRIFNAHGDTDISEGFGPEGR